MPYDLAAVERGYGEVVAEWNGHEILLRYRADLNNRALIAMKRLMIGVLALDGVTRFPDVEAMIDELQRVLLPSGPEVPKDQRGWDLTDDGKSIPITFDTLVDLPPGLPAAMLGAIFRDVNDPNRKRPSSAGWSAEASSEGHQTTTDSSETRNGQASLPGPLVDSTTRVTTSVGGTGSARSAMPRSARRTS
jgi:hypothetical protein